MEAALFSDNFAGAHSADDYPGQTNSRHVALERLRIALRLARRRGQPNSLVVGKLKVRMITGHRRNLRGRDVYLALPIHDPRLTWLDASHVCAKLRADFA